MVGFDEYNCKRTDKSIVVDKKEVVYEQVVHDSPLEIMTQLDDLSIDIADKTEELRGPIGE